MKPASQITDRAKRYRAQRNAPTGPRRCNFCASRKNVDIDHIDGNEDSGEPENLMYLCRPCNVAKGVTQMRANVGRRTRQYNPTAGARSFSQFRNCAAVLLGTEPGDVAHATEVIRMTTPERREKYAELIEQHNPFRSEAQRRKFFAMAARGEISEQTLKKFAAHNPTAAPTFAQYSFAVATHTRGAHDEGGAIIHATPASLRHRYAKQIGRIKRERRGEVPF